MSKDIVLLFRLGILSKGYSVFRAPIFFGKIGLNVTRLDSVEQHTGVVQWSLALDVPGFTFQLCHAVTLNPLMNQISLCTCSLICTEAIRIGCSTCKEC